MIKVTRNYWKLFHSHPSLRQYKNFLGCQKLAKIANEFILKKTFLRGDIRPREIKLGLYRGPLKKVLLWGRNKTLLRGVRVLETIRK